VAAGGILPARPPTIAAMIFEIYGAIHGQNVDWQEINLKSDRLLVVPVIENVGEF
jgi:hypothetical protein